MNEHERYLAAGQRAGCTEDQMRRFLHAHVLLQERQLVASGAARECDRADGPTAIGYGGARGGGKSHWLLAQMGADDCQLQPELKCLLLRKVGKANLENFQDLRRRLFHQLPHEFSASRGVLTFSNGSRIIAGHFQYEKDIDAYLGLEYDVIGIEEATTLSSRKHSDITTCCRTSKPNWRPRIYSTTNPGGVGHAWYRQKFIVPYQRGAETETRFIPARVTDNHFTNPDYAKVLSNLTGWQRRAWFEGDWDLAAGQFFASFRRERHVIDDFDDTRARSWFCALDYGFTHYTVCLLGCKDGNGDFYIVDEHAERLWLPERHAAAIQAMLARHSVTMAWVARGQPRLSWRTPPDLSKRPLQLSDLERFFAGTDVFSHQSDGTTVAEQYRRVGIRLNPANMNRQNGWAEILSRLGDPDGGLRPRLFIHSRCTRLLDCLPAMQHDPNRPEDALKVDADEEGIGGDDAADALRYLVATKPRILHERRLIG